MPQVSIVIVCMNRPDILFPCLDSIRAHTIVSYETLVVAYLFSQENLALLQERYPWVKVVQSTELRGFSENNNLALRQAKGRYCFIVNDDTLMHEPVIDRLVRDLESLPENAAAISPCICFGDGRIQTCGRTPWTAWRYAKHYLHWVDEGRTEGGMGSRIASASLRPLPSRGASDDAAVGPSLLSGRGWPEIRKPMPPSVFQTYTLNGACFLIKTAVFRKMGWFDERYFFTPEDIALGHALNDAGYSVWVHPQVCITHLAGGSVSAMEQAIKPARVRGSLIFYGEPLWLKCFIWSVELARYVKNSLLCREQNRKTARNVMRTVFSKQTPKEIFLKFKV